MTYRIIIPCYNCEKWISNCLESVIRQTSQDWEAVVINDGSTDRTGEIVAEITKDNPKIKVINNEVNEGSPIGSIVKGIKFLNPDPEDVILNVDGDDWLANNKVLEYLTAYVYSNSNVLMSYGQFAPLSRTYSDYCKPLANTRLYRKHGAWTTSHLRTYKMKLFSLIKDEDLRDEDGEYYKFAGDCALMYPLVEMAGLTRTMFVPAVLYVYNDTNELNEMKRDSKTQVATADRIKNKLVYQEIP